MLDLIDGNTDLVVERGILFKGPHGHLIRDRRLGRITKAVRVLMEKNDDFSGLRRVYIYGVTKPKVKGGGDEYHRYTAKCSMEEFGVYEAKWVLAICFSRERGWFVDPISILGN